MRACSGICMQEDTCTIIGLSRHSACCYGWFACARIGIQPIFLVVPSLLWKYTEQTIRWPIHTYNTHTHMQSHTHTHIYTPFYTGIYIHHTMLEKHTHTHTHNTCKHRFRFCCARGTVGASSSREIISSSSLLLRTTTDDLLWAALFDDPGPGNSCFGTIRDTGVPGFGTIRDPGMSGFGTSLEFLVVALLLPDEWETVSSHADSRVLLFMFVVADGEERISDAAEASVGLARWSRGDVESVCAQICQKMSVSEWKLYIWVLLGLARW